MIAKICPQNNQTVTNIDCESCNNKICNSEKEQETKSTLVSLMEEKIKNEWKNHTCEECTFCVFKRIMETSHCDVRIYRCMNEKSKRYLEDMDDFHIQRRACQGFVQKESKGDNNNE